MSICTHHIANYPNAHIIIRLLPLPITMCYFTDELIVNIAVSITDAGLLLGWYANDFFSGDILILQHQLTSQSATETVQDRMTIIAKPVS